MNLENICVQSTIEYEEIKRVNGNRATNLAHIETLKISMSEKQLVVPAILNEKMQIIDGQHRFDACIALDIPFYYIVIEGYGLADVQRMNTNMKNWTMDDFLQTYIELYKNGSTEYMGYIRFKDFINKYNIPLPAGIFLSNMFLADGIKSDAFKIGTFGFDEEKENIASIFIEEVIEIFSGLDDKKWFNLSFLKAYADFYFHEDYDSSIMIKRQSQIVSGTKHSLPFRDVSGVAGYRNMIIEAYNHATPRNKKMDNNSIRYVLSDKQKGK